ncbi:MAG: hypothetical protein WCI74_02585 [Actinomycetes bacterium]
MKTHKLTTVAAAALAATALIAVTAPTAQAATQTTSTGQVAATAESTRSITSGTISVFTIAQGQQDGRVLNGSVTTGPTGTRVSAQTDLGPLTFTPGPSKTTAYYTGPGAWQTAGGNIKYFTPTADTQAIRFQMLDGSVVNIDVRFAN